MEMKFIFERTALLHSFCKTTFSCHSITVRKAVIGFVFLLTAAQVTEAAMPSGNLHFTFSITDIYIPLFTPKENATVLDNISIGATVIGTYKHTTHSFKWFTCMSGVACIPDPGIVENSTELRRTFPVKTEPGKPRILNVELPQSLDGDYLLAGIYISLSPDVFYSQPSYREIVQKILPKKQELSINSTPPSFEYLVNFAKSRTSDARSEYQDCLFFSTPYGFPEISIPIVTQVDINSKQVRLVRKMPGICPLINSNSIHTPMAIPGHLPFSRIAAAQTRIDFSTADGSTHIFGKLPVTEKMTRWYMRNNEGVFASLNELGPFQEFSIRLRGDTEHPANGILPIRTESWIFFKKKLVKYSSDILYIGATYKKNSIATENIYFYNSEQVWAETKIEQCEEQGCRNALTEIRSEMSKPYEVLQAEVQSYMQLGLIPVD